MNVTMNRKCDAHTLPELIGQNILDNRDAPLEPVVFGTGDPPTLAGRIEQFVQERLGSRPLAVLFYRTSVGIVAGFALTDGRRVVLKVYQARWRQSFLEAVHRIQTGLVDGGFPAPRPLLPPTAFPDTTSVATLEEWVADPGMRPLHGGRDRRAAAHGLSRQICLARSMPTAGLADHPLGPVGDGLYPIPHSPLFDFRIRAQGAIEIDGWAKAAQRIRAADASLRVIAHTDWSARNIRVVDGRIGPVFDWDSLALVPESTAVGQAALTWLDTAEPETSMLSDPEGVAAFLDDYEAASGRRLPPEPRRTVFGAALWVLAYKARCEYALAARGTTDPHDAARRQLARVGPALLEAARR